MTIQGWNLPKLLDLMSLHDYSRMKFAKVTWLIEATSQLKAKICQSYLMYRGYITTQSWNLPDFSRLHQGWYFPKLLDLKPHDYTRLKFTQVTWLVKATCLLKDEIRQSYLTNRGYITSQGWNLPKLPDFSRLHQGWYFPKLLDWMPHDYTRLKFAQVTRLIESTWLLKDEICQSYLTNRAYITTQS